jgi:hypothetical protein
MVEIDVIAQWGRIWKGDELKHNEKHNKSTASRRVTSVEPVPDAHINVSGRPNTNDSSQLVENLQIRSKFSGFESNIARNELSLRIMIFFEVSLKILIAPTTIQTYGYLNN